MKNKEFEKYVYKIINKYQKILLLDKHTIEIKKGLEMQGSLMECVFNYPYLNVTINYGDKLVEKWKKKEDIIPYVVHEMCHPITDPLYCRATDRWITHEAVKDEREKLTDYICNIVIKNKL